MQPFGRYLAEQLAATGWSQRAFAQATKTPVSTIQAVIAGQRKPPKRRLAQWASVLKIDLADRDLFLLSGFLAHAPQEVRDAIERLLDAPTAARRVADTTARYRPDGS